MKPADVLLALLTVAIWGFNFVVIEVGLRHLPPVLFTALRFLFAALPLVFFVERPRIPLRILAGYSLFQFALQFPLLFSGMRLGFPPGLASLVIQLQAFFTMGLAVLLLNDRPRPLQIIGALIGLAGMGIVAVNLDAKPTLIGFVLVVAAGLSWAAANIVTKKIGRVNPLALVGWGSLLAVPPLLLVSAWTEGLTAWSQAYSDWNWMSVGAVLFQSYPNTLVGFGIWAYLLHKYPVAAVAPFSLLVPVAGMSSAALVLGEPMQGWKIGAGVLVLGGLALNQFGSRFGRTAPLPPPA